MARQDKTRQLLEDAAETLNSMFRVPEPKGRSVEQISQDTEARMRAFEKECEAENAQREQRIAAEVQQVMNRVRR